MLFTGLIGVVMFITVAMLWNEGLWSNALTFINAVFAVLLACNYFEPLADLLERQFPSYTYLWDFISLWLIFSVSFIVFRVFTDTISTHRVRFKLPVELVGRLAFSVLVGWTVGSFLCLTLHTAPLARTAVKEGFQKEPMSNNFLGFAPDRMWLGIMQSRSRTALSRSDESAESRYPEDEGKRVFDPESEFVFKYGQRRQDLHDNMERTGSMRIN